MKTRRDYNSENEKINATGEWLDLIIQAMKNLGGQASIRVIYAEVYRLKPGPLPKIQDIIYRRSSDTTKFQGVDLFKKAGKGVWALRDSAAVSLPPHLVGDNYISKTKAAPLSDLKEDAANALRTIKQYREYQHPGSPTWPDYIKEFVHVLGFSTKEQDPHLLTLSLMGSEIPKAVLIHIQPGKEFEEIVQGLTWKTHLHNAAEHFRVSWGVLTNGLQLKVLNFDDGDVNEFAAWSNFDEFIQNEDFGSFMLVYNVFSGFNKARSDAPKNKKGEDNRSLTQNSKGKFNHQTFLVEFWSQLIQKANANSYIQIMDQPKPRYYLHSRANKTGLVYSFIIRNQDAQIELFIDIYSEKRHEETFEHFHQHKYEIEAAFGHQLDWQFLPGKKTSRICYIVSNSGLQNIEFWDQLQDQLITSMVDLQKALQPYITTLP